MRSRLYSVLAVVVALVMALSACSPAATAEPTVAPAATEAPTEAPTATEAATEAAEPTEAEVATEEPAATVSDALPAIDPASLEGDIYAAGSSTVYPLAEAIAENFTDEGFAGEIKIDSIGSGGGFERFCKTGETDISNASRAIKDEEIANCEAIGRTPIPFLIGLDAIAVVVSQDNDFVEDLTIDQLGQIMTGEAATWADVNPEWPAEPILRYTPGTDSGTFDFFVETIIQKPRSVDTLDNAKALALSVSDNLQMSEDDNVLVQGVEGSPYAIGYFGYAYFQENSGNLRTVSIEGIQPSLETAESGEYTLSRPLYIYSDAQIMKDKPQVAGFINYFITNVNSLIAEVGYFPASEEKLEATRQAYLDAMK